MSFPTVIWELVYVYELPFGYLRARIYVRAPVPPNLRSSYVYTSFPMVIWELVYAYCQGNTIISVTRPPTKIKQKRREKREREREEKNVRATL